MLHRATNLNGLGFLPPPESNNPESDLDTSFNPFIVGINIVHFSGVLFAKTPDFLLIPVMEPGKKLEDKVTAYGNQDGEGMGRHLRTMLRSIG